jgi:hypothetical protein
LRAAPLGRGEPTAIHHTRTQPARDQFPGGELPELIEQVRMIDSVECGGQIRVQRPHTLTCRAASGHKDGLNRVLAAAAGPKPI